MSDQNVRFTCWISPKERAALQAMAEKNGASANYILRMALRQYIGLPVPQLQMLHVTNGTENERDS